MRVLVALCIVLGCNAQFVVRHGAPLMYSASPFTYSSPSIYPWVPHTQYHTQDIFGQAHFGHATLDHSRSEVRLANGQVAGSFSYIDPNGETQVTQYEAGPQGYKVKASNLPVAPEYTPDVAAAREEHLNLKADAAPARKKRSAGLLSYGGLPAVVHFKVAEGEDAILADVTKLSVAQLLGLPRSYMHGNPTVSAKPTLSVPAAVSKVTVETKHAEIVDTVIPTFKYIQPTIENISPYNNFPYSLYNYHTPLTYSGSAYPYHFGYPYNFDYTWAPTTYAAAAPPEDEDSSLEEDD